MSNYKNTFFISLCYLLVLFSSCSKKEEDYSLIPVKIGDKWGYIDQSGKIVINPQFSTASFFNEDMAVVSINDKYGYINKKGEYEITPTYKSAAIFSEDIAWVVKEGGAPTAINKKGEELYTLKEAEYVYTFNEGVVCFSISDPNKENGSLYGFADNKGNIIIPPTYQNAGFFSEGFAAVGNNEGKYGYINKKGIVVINYQFDIADGFENGKAVVSIDGAYGVIDTEGKFIINPQFDMMRADGDLYFVEVGDKYGWCDKKGKFVINPQFDQAGLFSKNELAPIKMADKCGYIDKKGKIVINPQFNYADVFWKDIAPVAIGSNYNDMKWGFIDKEGKYIVNPQFAKIGGRHYYWVSSDYFNIEAIITGLKNKLANNAVDGINFQTKLSDIISKYSMSESDFKSYNMSHNLKTFSLSKDAEMNLEMEGNVHNQVSDGWWGYQYILKKGATPEAFNCLIRLKEKGIGKEQAVYSELKKVFNLNDKGQCKSGNLYLYFDSIDSGISLKITSTPIEKEGNALTTEKDPVNDGTYEYEGTINNKYKITMTLRFSGNAVTGTYKYASSQSDISLSGERSGEEDMTLTENVNGKSTGTFTGKLINGEYSGTWINSDGTKTMPFQAIKK